MVLVGVTGSYAVIQGQEKRPVPAQSPSRTDYALKVSTKDMIAISLKAERISLSTIASDISNKLKVPVLLGRSAAKRPVTTDFKALPLESAMQLLAPQVYIDYEINRAPGVPPQPVGIYLNDEGDPPPSINAVVMANSQAMLIEGNTRKRSL
jgi:hypothetical protein